MHVSAASAVNLYSSLRRLRRSPTEGMPEAATWACKFMHVSLARKVALYSSDHSRVPNSAI